MKKNIAVLLIGLILLLSSFLSSPPSAKIHWKNIDTPKQAMNAMDELVPHGTEFDIVYERLSQQKADYFGSSGDTLIQYHSPYVSVRPLSLVSRKWMFNFFFSEKIMITYNLEEGLLGP